MISLILLLPVCILLFRGITTFFFLLQTFSWLFVSDKEFLKKQNINELPPIFILIPVLREQRRILQTLRYFLSHFKHPKIKIIVVTTQREFEKTMVGPSTFELVYDFIEREGISNRVSCINYPNRMGNMADQINYTLQLIKKSNSFIALYNADSRPHPFTFHEFSFLLKGNPLSKVFLQSSIFLKNFYEIQNNSWFINRFLQTSAILQTRWTLTHEIPRILRQSSMHIGPLKKYVNAHLVGHGLIMDLQTLKMIGGFPTITLTEDIFLGFIARSKQITIYPMKTLELADSPTTLKGLWNQLYVWYWGAMKHPTYLKYVLQNRKRFGIREITIPLTIFMQAMVSAIAWILAAPVILISFFLIWHFQTFWYTVIVLLSLFLYGPFQFLIIGCYFQKLIRMTGNEMKQISCGETILYSILSIPAMIFRSIPPYLSIFVELRNKIIKEEIYKPKTDD